MTAVVDGLLKDDSDNGRIDNKSNYIKTEINTHINTHNLLRAVIMS